MISLKKIFAIVNLFFCVILLPSDGLAYYIYHDGLYDARSDIDLAVKCTDIKGCLYGRKPVSSFGGDYFKYFSERCWGKKKKKKDLNVKFTEICDKFVGDHYIESDTNNGEQGELIDKIRAALAVDKKRSFEDIVGISLFTLDDLVFFSSKVGTQSFDHIAVMMSFHVFELKSRRVIYSKPFLIERMLVGDDVCNSDDFKHEKKDFPNQKEDYSNISKDVLCYLKSTAFSSHVKKKLLDVIGDILSDSFLDEPTTGSALGGNRLAYVHSAVDKISSDIDILKGGIKESLNRYIMYKFASSEIDGFTVLPPAAYCNNIEHNDILKIIIRNILISDINELINDLDSPVLRYRSNFVSGSHASEDALNSSNTRIQNNEEARVCLHRGFQSPDDIGDINPNVFPLAYHVFNISLDLVNDTATSYGFKRSVAGLGVNIIRNRISYPTRKSKLHQKDYPTGKSKLYKKDLKFDKTDESCHEVGVEYTNLYNDASTSFLSDSRYFSIAHDLSSNGVKYSFCN